jgi:hypothetical protein
MTLAATVPPDRLSPGRSRRGDLAGHRASGASTDVRDDRARATGRAQGTPFLDGLAVGERPALPSDLPDLQGYVEMRRPRPRRRSAPHLVPRFRCYPALRAHGRPALMARNAMSVPRWSAATARGGLVGWSLSMPLPRVLALASSSPHGPTCRPAARIVLGATRGSAALTLRGVPWGRGELCRPAQRYAGLPWRACQSYLTRGGAPPARIKAWGIGRSRRFAAAAAQTPGAMSRWSVMRMRCSAKRDRDLLLVSPTRPP